MHKEIKNENKQQKNVFHPLETTGGREGSCNPPPDQLSDVWRELLGNRWNEKLLSAFPNDAPIPTLEVDPWSALLQAKGVEIVDLQRIHLQISDQEVEQLLEVIPDDPDDCETKS
jgi:hypothetical protein